MARKRRSKMHAQKWAKRRRALVLALTVASVGVFFAKSRGVQPAVAAKATKPRVTAASASPTPSVTRSATPLRTSPSPTPTPAPSVPVPSPTPTPTPTPAGPPFVLDAAPSCAGSTALIDVQVAATTKRPIMRLELLLDGTASKLTPVPGYPLTQYAGRSSGHASLSGVGEWLVRATDSKGIIEVQPFPYACA